MPRLNHKKARTGCQRCKARKVKCDENKPRCAACARHDVPCEYLAPVPRAGSHQPFLAPPSPPGPRALAPVVPPQEQAETRNVLELRLMHQWTAHTSKTLSSLQDFWQLQVPLLALSHFHLMDAMLSLSALHLSKASTDGSSDLRSSIQATPYPNHQMLAQQVASLGQDGVVPEPVQHQRCISREGYDMLVNSRIYFDRAIEGHRMFLPNELTLQNVEPIYVATILASLTALFTLSEPTDDPSMPALELDPILWIQLAARTRDIADRWYELAGEGWMSSSGAFEEKLALGNDELFRPDHAEAFPALLAWTTEYGSVSDEDRDVYQKAVSYLGFVHKRILDKSDSHFATCRRIIALPALCPPRFTWLVQERQPRAMVILAYIFAILNLANKTNEEVWFRGIAEQQIPKFYERIAPEWRAALHWPMQVVTGEDEGLATSNTTDQGATHDAKLGVT